ncbi:MAG: VCBS repeat-containing protein [Desulfuromonadales bacterium]|nr:VCBS repeat-containing protein [Desulfuromonadales bacterium]
MNRLVFFSLLFFLSVPVLGFAQLPESLVGDFAPLDGYVIMPVDQEYLVDLDASKGLREGDILTLLEPGEKVIHPVTKEILGSLDRARGFLRVTRLKAGYAYSRLLSAAITPQKGDRVKRFEQVAARIEGLPSNLADELKAGLPHLEWLGESADVSALLVFGMAGNRLVVKDSAGTLLKSYPFLSEAPALISPPAETPVPAAPTTAGGPVMSPAAGPVGIPTAGIVPAVEPAQKGQAPAIIKQARQESGLWMGPNLRGNQVGFSVGDFDGDGRQETAIATEEYLLIAEILQGTLTEEAKVEFARGTSLLSVDAIDLDGNGFPELYLSGASGNKLSSQVVEFSNGGYHITISGIPWFFRVGELPGEGQTLLAQPVAEGDDPYSENMFRVLRSGHDVTEGRAVPLPKEVNVFSFLPLAEAEGQQLYAYLTKGDYLKVITATGDDQWESSDYFGGSKVSFYATDPNGPELVAPVYVQQRLLKTAGGDILSAQNEGNRTLQRFRTYQKSRVVALGWNGFAMQERWRTVDQEGYLVDFALADADNDGQVELVTLMQYQRENLIRKGRSTVVIYELNP